MAIDRAWLGAVSEKKSRWYLEVLKNNKILQKYEWNSEILIFSHFGCKYMIIPNNNSYRENFLNSTDTNLSYIPFDAAFQALQNPIFGFSKWIGQQNSTGSFLRLILLKNSFHRPQENECHLRTVKAREVGFASFCRGTSGLSFAYFRYISTVESKRIPRKP